MTDKSVFAQSPSQEPEAWAPWHPDRGFDIAMVRKKESSVRNYIEASGSNAVAKPLYAALAPGNAGAVEAAREQIAKAWLYGHCHARGFAFPEVDYLGCRGSKLWHDSLHAADLLLSNTAAPLPATQGDGE